MNNTNNQNLKLFTAGFVSASAIISVGALLYSRSKNHRKYFTARKQRATTTENDSIETQQLEMDSPDAGPLRLIRKAETAILKRTSRVIIVVERCTNEHNYSAILRTAEALGIQHIWLISPSHASGSNDLVDNSLNITNSENNTVVNKQKAIGVVPKRATLEDINHRNTHNIFAQKAVQWLTIRDFDTTSECIKALRKDNREIWVTDLSQHADCLTREGLGMSDDKDSLLPERLAIVFGTEAVGCSTEILNAADRRVYLPLYGFADSLNLSVATSLCLLQLYHLDPTVIGDMSENERNLLRKKWFTKLAAQRLLTSKEKKDRQRLVKKCMRLDELHEKQTFSSSSENGYSLHTEQKDILTSLEKNNVHQELKEFDAKLEKRAYDAIKEFIENPPSPFFDMRRNDIHRVCYVGKKTRSRNKEAWANMAATAYENTTGSDGSKRGISANFYRDRAS